MKRAFFNFFLISILILTTTVFSSQIGEVELDTETIKLFQNIRTGGTLVALLEDSVVYYRYNEEKIQHDYYRYYYQDNSTVPLGSVNNTYIARSGETVQIDNCLWTWENICRENSFTSFDCDAVLIKIDLIKNELIEVCKDSFDQTLLYIDFYGDDLFTFAGKRNGNQGVTYIEKMNTASPKEDSRQIIIEKIWDIKTKTGEEICQFAQKNERLYVLTRKAQKNELDSYQLEVYKLDGEYVKTIALDYRLESVFRQNWPAELAIYGNHFFFSNYNSHVILAELKRNEMRTVWEKRNVGKTVSVIPGVTDTLLVDCIENKMWKIDGQLGTLNLLDISYDGYGEVIQDSDGNIFLFERSPNDINVKIRFFNLSKVSVKETISLKAVHSNVRDLIGYQKNTNSEK